MSKPQKIQHEKQVEMVLFHDNDDIDINQHKKKQNIIIDDAQLTQSIIDRSSEEQEKDKQKLPTFSTEISLLIKTSQIKDIFVKVCHKTKYNCTQQAQFWMQSGGGQMQHVPNHQHANINILAHKNITSALSTFTNRCLKCLPFMKGAKQIYNVLKLSVFVDHINCTKIVSLSSICGDFRSLLKFINEFQMQLSQNAQKHNSTKKNISSLTNDELKLQSINIYSSESYRHLQDEELTPKQSYDEQVMQCSIQNSAYQHFYKILCQTQYTIGERIQKYLHQFQQKYDLYEDEQSSHGFNSTIEMMQNVYGFINEIVNDFFLDYNYGLKQEASKIMPYCRISVELYIFRKLNDFIYATYSIYEEQNSLYVKMKLQVTNGYKNEELFEKLDFENNLKLDYQLALNELQRIGAFETPHQKLQCLMKCMALVNYIIINNTGQEQKEPCLINTEQEIPIIIYLLLRCSCQNIVIDLHLILDYLKVNDYVENKEIKTINNFLNGIQYINDEFHKL